MDHFAAVEIEGSMTPGEANHDLMPVELMQRCMSAAPENDAALLRDCLTVLEQAPLAIRQAIGCELDGPGLEALIEANAMESAAHRLLGKSAYMLSSSGSNHFIVSMVCDGMRQDLSFNAATLPAATCGAVLSAMEELSSGE